MHKYAIAAAVAAGLIASSSASGAVLRSASPGDPVVAFVPLSSAPTPPAGLKVACFDSPTDLHMSTTCPVVQSNGNTTWAFSYIDNRVSMALVTYDAKGNVVGNVNKDGARYVWDIHVSDRSPIVFFFGQANQFVTATWDETGGTQSRIPR
jgi:hypothetical protein